MNSLRILRAAIEVKRRYSEAGALDMAVGDFQRQRRPGNDWLDWSCWFLKPLDDMTTIQAECLCAFAFEPEGWVWTGRKMYVAEEGLRLMEKMVAPSLWKQGDRIAGLL